MPRPDCPSVSAETHTLYAVSSLLGRRGKKPDPQSPSPGFGEGGIVRLLSDRFPSAVRAVAAEALYEAPILSSKKNESRV